MEIARIGVIHRPAAKAAVVGRVIMTTAARLAMAGRRAAVHRAAAGKVITTMADMLAVADRPAAGKDITMTAARLAMADRAAAGKDITMMAARVVMAAGAPTVVIVADGVAQVTE